MANGDTCGMLNFSCQASQAASDAVAGWSQNAIEAIVAGLGNIAGLIGTWWVQTPTTDVISGNGDDSRAIGSHAPVVGGLETTLSYAMWVSLAVAVVSLLILGARFARSQTSGHEQGERLTAVLFGVLLISSASAITTAVMPSGQAKGNPAVSYIMNSLWWYTAALVILSVIVGGARIAWEQHASEGKRVLTSLLTFTVVSGAGVTIVGLLVAASDSFSSWMIQGAMTCDVGVDKGQCFGTTVLGMLGLAAGASAIMPVLGVAIVLVVAALAFIVALFQAGAMLFRNGVLAVLTGILPISAAATNTDMGKAWFEKVVGWIVGFLLFKPAAAIVYATAFRLAGTNPMSKGADGLGSILTGLFLMFFALIAIGPLTKIAVPAVSAVVGRGGASAATLALAAAPTGARALGALRSKLGSRQSGGGPIPHANISPVPSPSGASTTTPIKGEILGGSSGGLPALGAGPEPGPGPLALPAGDGSGGGAIPAGPGPGPGLGPDVAGSGAAETAGAGVGAGAGGGAAAAGGTAAATAATGGVAGAVAAGARAAKTAGQVGAAAAAEATGAEDDGAQSRPAASTLASGGAGVPAGRSVPAQGQGGPDAPAVNTGMGATSASAVSTGSAAPGSRSGLQGGAAAVAGAALRSSGEGTGSGSSTSAPRTPARGTTSPTGTTGAGSTEGGSPSGATTTSSK